MMDIKFRYGNLSLWQSMYHVADLRRSVTARADLRQNPFNSFHQFTSVVHSLWLKREPLG